MARFHRFVLVLVWIAVGSASLSAANVVVDSVSVLQAKIATAAPGDVITVKNGVYTTSAALPVACVGTAAQPITIAAETVGGVELTGTHGFEIVAPAAHVVVSGFKFTHASGHASIAGGASHVRLTRNTFQCSGAGAYLTVSGDDVEIDHNEFRDKATLGNMLSVTGTGSQVARRLNVHHNYFHDFANAHGNGAETIRFGLSGLSMSDGEGLVEYNLFVRCTGENELISNKSCANTYRYNTFLDSPGAELSERHGNRCRIYANCFKNTQGIRICGDRHEVFSNYLEGNSIAITMCNGDGEVADGAKLTSHDRPDHCVIAFNTLVDNRVNFQMNGRTHGLGATDTTFANNLIQGGGKAVEISATAPYLTPTWRGNLLWETEPGDLPAEGFIKADPHLTRAADGLYRPGKASPVIGAAASGFAWAEVDVDGQPRPAEKKSIGADEISSAAIIAHPLSATEVGPLAE